ncbi:MAG TPA: APC family permease [Candidatus Acidoferrales bacterium]|nr:APC family permease [Candidatus Acidoferrales bacterium]
MQAEFPPFLPPPSPSIFNRLRRLYRLVLGAPKNPLDPHIFHQVSLIAFLAWVGLGADGLSSACYGPEEAFLALGSDRFLAPFLALATAITVLVISASYSQIIELFPTGGGGYLVASKLLGPRAGVVSGSALVVDYVLTVAISIASGADAIFSFLPLELQHVKLLTEAAVIGLLILLNLRGAKESVTLLVPVFLGFIITHTIVVVYGVWVSAGAIPATVANTAAESMHGLREQGFLVMLGLFLHAYSMGAGTYTGIEAVSNGLPILRDPKVQTGKKTMLYMATSLAFTAGGILVCYLLAGVQHHPGRTLNAVLIERLASGWHIGHLQIGNAFLLTTLLCEGALLFVAAQTGFLDGPRVLASMAVDSWVPHRFYQLSDRLVTKNGTMLMGMAALGILFYTQGEVRLLVVLYSINVFLTFTLSQLGMCIHWWQVRREEPRWGRRLAVNGLGLLLTSAILAVTLSLKFAEGGWVTAVITSALIVTCLWIRRHYDQVGQSFQRLDSILTAVPSPPEVEFALTLDNNAPTAVLLVTGYNGLGIHSFLSIPRLFADHFKQFVFVSVGVIDSSKFKGAAEVEHLRQSTEEFLRRYVGFCNSQGLRAESRYALGTDTIDILVQLCGQVAKEYPRAVFFSGKLIFEEETFLTRLLHNQAALTLQRRLQFAGLQTVVLPIRAS